MKRAVLLTGGTGFVGSTLARALASRGASLHALVRPTARSAELTGLGARLHPGDVTSARDVRAAVETLARGAAGAPCWVIHCAAVISYRTRDRQLQRTVNVEGTRHVLEACRAVGVERLLHVSSVVAVGPAPPGAVQNEDSPYREAGLACDYMRTKRAAEDLVVGAAGALDVVVVNPGAIFGAGARGPNTLRFLRQLARGKLGPFSPPGALSVVGVQDVAEGCLLALERGRRGRRYLLTESWLESRALFDLAARTLGVQAPRWQAPRAVWGGLAVSCALLDRVWPLELAAPQALRMLGARWAMDSSRARAELGWRPRPFPEVLNETIATLRARGELG